MDKLITITERMNFYADKIIHFLMWAWYFLIGAYMIFALTTTSYRTISCSADKFAYLPCETTITTYADPNAAFIFTSLLVWTIVNVVMVIIWRTRKKGD